MDDKKMFMEQRPDYLVCTCWGVMRSEIVQAISEGKDDLDSLKECLMIGTGCSSCVPEVTEILREETGKG